MSKSTAAKTRLLLVTPVRGSIARALRGDAPGNRPHAHCCHMKDRRSKSTGDLLAIVLQVYAPPLRRHGNNAAGKSAAERRSRCGRGAIGRGLGSGAITLR